MFIAIPSDRSDHGSPKTFMNIGLGNGRLATAIAAMLLLAALSGIGTRSFTAPNNLLERGGFSTPTVSSEQVLRNGSPTAASSSTSVANETASPRSDIMDSYESVPSLAALAKQGNTGTRFAPEAAGSKVVVASGISP